MKSWYRLTKANEIAALIQSWLANSFSCTPFTQALFSRLDSSLRGKLYTQTLLSWLVFPKGGGHELWNGRKVAVIYVLAAIIVVSADFH